MPTDMTPEKAAEVLEELADGDEFMDCESPNIKKYRYAASLCRKVAAGEMREVKHGTMVNDIMNDKVSCPDCGKRVHKTYRCCPYCGLWFDGKDDSDGQAD